MYTQIFKVDLRKKIFLKQGLKDQQGMSCSYNITLRCIEFFASWILLRWSHHFMYWYHSFVIIPTSKYVAE